MSKSNQQVNLRIIEVTGLPGRVTAILVEDEVCAVSSMADGSSTKIMFPEEVFSAVAEALIASLFKIVVETMGDSPGAAELTALGDAISRDDIVRTTEMTIKYSDLREAGLVHSTNSIVWTNGQAIIKMATRK